MIWLLDKKCRWNEDIFCVAAQHGSHETLNWLIENGCPVPREVSAFFKIMGDAPIIDRMLNNGYLVRISFIQDMF